MRKFAESEDYGMAFINVHRFINITEFITDTKICEYNKCRKIFRCGSGLTQPEGIYAGEKMLRI